VRVKAPFYGDCADGEPPFIYRPWVPPSATLGSANNIEPGYCLQKSRNLILVLVFEQPVSLGRLSLRVEGAGVPEWDGQLLNERLAVISLHAGLKNVGLEIRLLD